MKSRRELLKLIPFLAAAPLVRITDKQPEFKLLEQPQIPQDVYKYIADSQARVEAATGKFESLDPAAKEQVRRSLFMMLKLFNDPKFMEVVKTQGYQVNINEVFRLIQEVSGWKNTYQIIRPI